MVELGRAINHEIRITPSNNNGFIIKIGCGRFVAETKEKLLEGIGEYLDNPQGMERTYNRSQPEHQPEPGRESDQSAPETQQESNEVVGRIARAEES